MNAIPSNRRHVVHADPLAVPRPSALDEPRAREGGVAAGRLAGCAWAVLTVLIFSGWFVVTRFSVTRELRFWDITALRFGIGAIVLAPAVLRPGSQLPAAAWRTGFVFMLLWGAPFVLLVALGLQLTSAAQAAAVAPTLMPIFTGIFARILLRESQGKVRWLGYGTILIGLAGLLGAGALVHARPAPGGLLALAAAAALWAAYTLVFRRSGLTAIQAAALICVWSSVVYLPAYLMLGLGRFGHASVTELVVQAVYQGVMMSGVALVAFNRAVGLLGATATTAVIALLPVVAAILAVPVLGEIPTPLEGTALLVVVGGVLLAASSNAKRLDLISIQSTEERR